MSNKLSIEILKKKINQAGVRIKVTVFQARKTPTRWK